MHVSPFHDPATGTVTYVVSDPHTGDAVVIDPVLDFDARAVAVHHTSVNRVCDHIDSHGLTLHAVIETHAHADHLSASQVLKTRYGAAIAASEHIAGVQEIFAEILGLGDNAPRGGVPFDHLLKHNHDFDAGSLSFRVIHTPGHTPACICLAVEDAVFTGDALFMPDFGTGRCDFPQGSAEALYDSVVDRLYTLPDETRVFVGHDYGPGGRDIRWETTIGASKRENKQLRADTMRSEFVRWRTERDATLQPPALLFPSLHVNIFAGQLPAPDSNGRRYLRLPMDVFDTGNTD